MDIRLDDLTHPAVLALIAEHLRSMYEATPPESVHALDTAALRQPGVTFWTAWDGDELLGQYIDTLDRDSDEFREVIASVISGS